MKHPDSFWQRYRYYLSGIVLLFPLWYFYQALHPQFPAPWPSQQLGPFTITPMPLNLKPPYIHHDQYLKDFYLAFQQGDVAQIRQGYVNLGPEALPLGQLQQAADGILHGSRHGQHVHAIAPATLDEGDKLWLTIETWEGEILIASWDLPVALLTTP